MPCSAHIDHFGQANYSNSREALLPGIQPVNQKVLTTKLKPSSNQLPPDSVYCTETFLEIYQFPCVLYGMMTGNEAKVLCQILCDLILCLELLWCNIQGTLSPLRSWPASPIALDGTFQKIHGLFIAFLCILMHSSLHWLHWYFFWLYLVHLGSCIGCLFIALALSSAPRRALSAPKIASFSLRLPPPRRASSWNSAHGPDRQMWGKCYPRPKA